MQLISQLKVLGIDLYPVAAPVVVQADTKMLDEPNQYEAILTLVEQYKRPQYDPVHNQWTVAGKVTTDKVARQMIAQNAQADVEKQIVQQALKAALHTGKQVWAGEQKAAQNLVDVSKQGVKSIRYLQQRLNNLTPDEQYQHEVLQAQLDWWLSWMEGTNIESVSPALLQLFDPFPVLRAAPRNLNMCNFQAQKHAATNIKQQVTLAPWRIITFPSEMRPGTELCYDVVELWERLERAKAHTAEGHKVTLSNAPGYANLHFRTRNFTDEDIQYITVWHSSYVQLDAQLRAGQLSAAQIEEAQALGRRLFKSQAAEMDMKGSFDNLQQAKDPAQQEQIEAEQTSWGYWVSKLNWLLKIPLRVMRALLNHPYLIQMLVVVWDLLRLGLCVVVVGYVLSGTGVSWTLIGKYMSSILYQGFVARAFIIMWRISNGFAIRALTGVSNWMYQLTTWMATAFASVPVLAYPLRAFAAFTQLFPKVVSTHAWIWGTLTVGTVSGFALMWMFPVLGPVIAGAAATANVYAEQVASSAAMYAMVAALWDNIALLLQNELYIDSLSSLVPGDLVAGMTVPGPAELGWFNPSTFSKILVMGMGVWCGALLRPGRSMQFCESSMKLVKNVFGLTYLTSALVSVLMDLYQLTIGSGGVKQTSCVRAMFPSGEVPQLNENFVYVHERLNHLMQNDYQAYRASQEAAGKTPELFAEWYSRSTTHTNYDERLKFKEVWMAAAKSFNKAIDAVDIRVIRVY